MSELIGNKYLEQFVMDKVGIPLQGKHLEAALYLIQRAVMEVVKENQELKKGDLMATTKKKKTVKKAVKKSK